jgi:transcriptional regulator with XRE-family HTH domain
LCICKVGLKQLKDQELINQIVSFLKLLREENGLTQEDVYNDTGIHIARIETRKVNISISTLAALSKYFNLTLEDFFKRLND